jgi:hypothetical protein
MTNETINIQIGDEVIELTGADKEAYIAQREADMVEVRLVEAKNKAILDARANAITKLAESAGLSEDEINAIIGAQ